MNGLFRAEGIQGAVAFAVGSLIATGGEWLVYFSQPRAAGPDSSYMALHLLAYFLSGAIPAAVVVFSVRGSFAGVIPPAIAFGAQRSQLVHKRCRALPVGLIEPHRDVIVPELVPKNVAHSRNRLNPQAPQIKQCLSGSFK